MSVLIKGMEKPKNCIWLDGKCPLLGDDDDCKLQDCQEEWAWQDQYKGCPLSDAPDTNVDTISRQAAIKEFGCCELTPDGGIDVNYAIDFLNQLPPAQSEQHEIGYFECANVMLKMWNDNVLTNGEYKHIMDKLNAHWAERRKE